MRYEKIRGKSVSECLMQLRSKYGSDQIVVLAYREVKEGGVLGSSLLSRRLFEIDYMIREEGPNRSTRPAIRPSAAKSSATTSPSFASTAKLKEEQAESELFRKLVEKSLENSREPADKRSGDRPDTAQAEKHGKEESSRSNENPMGAGKKNPVWSPVEADYSAEELIALLRPDEDQGEMDELPPFPPAIPERKKKDSTSSTSSIITSKVQIEGDYSGGDSNLEAIRGRLLYSQMSVDFADRFIQKLSAHLSQVEKKEIGRVEQKTLEGLASVIRTVPDIAPTRGDCRAVMLIGPTGSGKTTSLAKLAARYYIMEKREVSLYSLDHYRIAATEQLKSYANVMGLPFYNPLTPEEFKESMARDGAELMMIDTSGISYQDKVRLQELKRFIDICPVRLEKHLVIAANTNPSLLESLLQSYDFLGFEKIILTKLDETEFIGAFIEVADKINRPFSYLMNGQGVPGDILAAAPMEMARLLLKP